MWDFKIARVCDHTILDEAATIQGLSPNYFSILRFLSDGSTDFIEIREFAATEGLSNYQYSRDGFTNWALSADFRQINWNSGGIGAGVRSIVDGSSHILPAQAMLISYRANVQHCPLCSDTGKERMSKDVDFDEAGQIRIVEGHDKVKQAIFKALITEVGADEVLPAYGSTLSATVGAKYTAATEFALYNSIQNAIQFLVDEQYTQSDLTAAETILALNEVSIAPDFEDPRIIRVRIGVKTGDFEVTPVEFSLVYS